jgi:NTE family protein
MLQGLGFLFGSPQGDAEAPVEERKKRRLKIGIALGGGAARGWAHIGILKRLNAAGIVPDVIAGTSIGALCGGCYVAGKLAELETFARSLTKRSMFSLLDITLRGGGLIGGRKLTSLLDNDLMNERIENMSRKFVAVATEIKTGHEVWLSKGSLVDAMRASYAMPGVFQPVKLGGRWLIDGAFVNPAPVSVCRAFGADLVIASVLHADNFGRGSIIPDHGSSDEELLAKKSDDRIENIALSADRLMRRKLLGGVDGAPGFTTVMVEAFNITQDRIARARLAGDPPDVLISPKLGNIGLFEFHRASEAIAIGWETVDKILPEIKEAQDALA